MYDRFGYNQEDLVNMAKKLLAQKTSELYYVDPEIQPLIETLVEIIAVLIQENVNKAIKDYQEELARNLRRSRW